MEHGYILSILYEMALAIGGEVSVKPLLTKTLRRLLYHTSCPAGFVCLGVPGPPDAAGMVEVTIDAAVGDYELADRIGKTMRLPERLLVGPAEHGNDESLLTALPDRTGRYKGYVRLPIDGQGVIVLLAPGRLNTALPITQVFEPVMESLSRAIVLCRSHDAYTGGLIAARDASQSALATSEERSRAISAAVLDALMMVDDTGALVYWNPAAERILGYRADEVIGRPLHQLLAPLDRRDAANEGLAAFRNSGLGPIIGRTFEAQALHRDGHQIPVQLSISALELSGRWHAVGILRDITDFKRNQELLQRLNRELRAISSCNQTLMRADDEQTLLNDVCRIICDDAGSRLAWVGYPEQDEAMTVRPVAWAGVADGDLVAAGVTWADTERGRGPTGTAIRSGRTACVQDYATDPTVGPWREDAVHSAYRSSIALPLKDETATTFGVLNIHAAEPNAFTPDEIRLLEELSGDLAFGISVLRTRTERRRAEQALQESEERYRRFVEDDVAGVFVTMPDGRLVTCNPAFARMFGFASVADALATNVVTIYQDHAAREAVLAELRARGRFDEREMAWQRRDGSTMFAIETAIADLDEAGEIAQIRGYLIDVTERKRLEEQLRQAQKMEAIGRLAGGVAHDFNNLLTVINGYADMLDAGIGPDDGLHEDVQEIRRAGDRAAALTRQLLAFSRRQVFQPTVIDLNEVVAGIAPMLRRLVGEQIELRAATAPKVGRVRADPYQIEQVLLNLVVNARDAMPAGGTLTIETADARLDAEYARAHPGVLSGPYVLVAVRDTGTGMDKATMDHLFEPFFTTKALGEGTGLGLATVYGIVAQAGGHVTVSSEPGEGSLFRVFLPLVDETADAPTEAVVEAPRGGAEAILLVEDEEAVRAFVERVLRGLGYRVSSARCGDDALALAARDGPIDLLITDIMLPGLNGCEVSERLTALQPSLKTLFISGYAEDTIVHRGELDHGVAFLAKPFAPDALGHAVREALRAR